jgi:hypothetical protein
MATNSSTPDVPEAHITRPDEPKSSSNSGLNISLVLTVVLSLACIIWAALSIPHWNFNGDATRPENMRENAGATDPSTLAPGTNGAVMPNKGKEHDLGETNYNNGQALQGDAITVGPGAPPAVSGKTTK